MSGSGMTPGESDYTSLALASRKSRIVRGSILFVGEIVQLHILSAYEKGRTDLYGGRKDLRASSAQGLSFELPVH
ncbi:MAG: hypothetical protein JKY56_06805 [Kofleriaceae bacterium]|nr:hypothetical protein [Kofleriaceae bacterium]